MQDWQALEHVADELLEDSSFAAEVKSEHHIFILKITMLSGRSTVVAPAEGFNLTAVLEWACSKLDIEYTGKEVLLHGSECVPPHARVQFWPGILPHGEVTEYTLILSAS
eukprot:3621146-Amphidinium_carterae.1